jgi:hypothetical protein
MIRTVFLAALALALVPAAQGRPRHQPQPKPSFFEALFHVTHAKPVRYAGRHIGTSIVSGDRPAQCRGIPWCGCWLRLRYGMADVRFNLARAWARVGLDAGGPVVGAIAVWRHHVGEITGVPGPGRLILKSGNDGGAVRERERSTRGIIAYRRLS